MGVLSERYVLKLLQQYVKSKTGKEPGFQAKIDEVLQNIRQEFIKVVSNVITSFRGDDVFISMGERDSNGNVRASINVNKDALRRESLHYINKDMSIGHGDGVEDILALFTHGYTISKRPYGFWARDQRTSDLGSPLVRIGALMHRDPNPFLSEFVDRMNMRYDGVCKVSLNDKYKNKGGD